MNIFELSEEEIKKILQNELNKVTPEELLEELIECGLSEEINIVDQAEYNTMQTVYSNECNLWVHKEKSGWTNLFKRFAKKNDFDDLKEAV